MRQGSHRNRWLGFVILVCLFLSAMPLWAQHNEHDQTSLHEEVITGHDHHEAVGRQEGWEGSVAGIAYSEFNHHLAGMLVLIIGLSELRQALAMPSWAWTRFLLPGALLAAGSFLLIWSDHDAWPIGSLSFMQTFFGSDSEIFQHKSYALLSLTVGTIEMFRRFGQIGHTVWAAPLPLYAIIGGLMLFGHSHGGHPSAHKIAMDHALMGTMAVTAGSSKLLSNWFHSPSHTQSSKWELLWPGLILLIGIQLLIYSE
jgi:putative copper resistance protein D